MYIFEQQKKTLWIIHIFFFFCTFISIYSGTIKSIKYWTYTSYWSLWSSNRNEHGQMYICSIYNIDTLAISKFIPIIMMIFFSCRSIKHKLFKHLHKKNCTNLVEQNQAITNMTERNKTKQKYCRIQKKTFNHTKVKKNQQFFLQ